jgi:type II secretory pathway component PulJ
MTRGARDRRFHAEAGLTFPELLVVSVILVSLLGLVYASFRTQAGATRRESAKVVTQTEMRLWLDRMVREIREAGYDPREANAAVPTFTITGLSPTEIRFTTDFDKDGVLDADSRENVGFRRNGDALERWLGGSSWRPVVRGIESFALTCFDAVGDEITCSSSPSLKTNVSAIRIALTARAATGGTPGVAPPTISQTATVELRNEIL